MTRLIRALHKFSFLTFTLALLTAWLTTTDLHAQLILFGRSTDTIALAGQTNLTTSVTYEAQVYFSSTYQERGVVFNEWTNGSEDKWFVVGPSLAFLMEFFEAGDNREFNSVGFGLALDAKRQFALRKAA